MKWLFKFGMFLVLVFLLVGFHSEVSYAHNGSLDELGGHFRNKDCVYLLHKPTELVKSASTMEELIALIQTYNSNDCKDRLTADRIDLEGYELNDSSVQTTETSDPTTSHSSNLELGQRYPATLERCVDGDTAVFSVNGTSYSTRFLFIDTPESTNQKEPFGEEASDFTCDFLESGDIVIETDGDSLFDKYDRLLAWVFVDNQLHQQVITEQGLVEDFYDYGDYLYEDTIREAMDIAKETKLGIYGEEDSSLLGWVLELIENIINLFR